MAKLKKIPIRMCCGCGENRPKRELIRIVKSPDDIISLDTTGKKSGRGAYICPNLDCLNKVQKSKRLDKIFLNPVPTNVYEELRNEFTKNH